MEALGWFFRTGAPSDWLGPFLRAVIICFVLYQLDTVFLIIRLLVRHVFGRNDQAQEPQGGWPSAMLVLPTLMRNDDELVGLQRAMLSVASNGYRGKLIVVACVDDLGHAGALGKRLRRWAAEEPLPANVRFEVTGTPQRAGKAMAMEAGVAWVSRLAIGGMLAEFPRVFFNMDADSELAPGALERMVARLTRRRRIAGTPPLIVASNVSVRRADCFRSWRDLLRPESWIALLVAREYLTSLTLSRHNSKLIPGVGVSGALYCTWSEVHLEGPGYAAFMQTLRLRDWVAWWFGYAPPQFSKASLRPLPEAMTGPGDDTWVAWMSCIGWWKDGRICFDFPRTPLHALGRLTLSYISRPLAYDPRAIVFTKTPTTVRGLYNQRLRWNTSRVRDVHRWFFSLLYHWNVGLPVFAGLALVVLVNGGIAIGLLAMPFVAVEAQWLPFAILAGLGYLAVRLTGSLAAMALAGTAREDWVKLLCLPLSAPYHLLFNIAPTVVGLIKDVFLFGLPTTFSPENTLMRSGLTRIALAYRARRALLLAWRSLIYGDVPFGAFWFGWGETHWTPSGFEGWSSGKRPPVIYARRSANPGGARRGPVRYPDGPELAAAGQE